MEAGRFDHWTRAFPDILTRRGLVAALRLGSAWSHDAAVAKKGKNKKKKVKRNAFG